MERDEVLDAKKGLHAAEEERQSANEMALKKLKDTSILAPFQGVISEKFVNVGDCVDDKTMVASIVDLSPIKLRVRWWPAW